MLLDNTFNQLESEAPLMGGLYFSIAMFGTVGTCMGDATTWATIHPEHVCGYYGANTIQPKVLGRPKLLIDPVLFPLAWNIRFSVYAWALPGVSRISEDFQS